MFTRYAQEVLRAIAGKHYEVSPEGLYLPRSRAFVHGVYTVRTRFANGEATDWEDIPNLFPTEGLTWMLDCLVAATGVAAYIALYATAISPTAAWTAASFPATSGEITSGSEGYSEATRVAWGPAAAAAANKDNYAAPSAFTIATATTLAVNGIGLLTVSTKGGTTGKLISATRFAAAKSFSATDEFDVKYRLSLTSS